MSDAKVSDCPQCDAKRTSLTCDQCGLTLGDNWIGEVERLRAINKDLLEVAESFVMHVDREKLHEEWSWTYPRAKAAILKAEGK